MSSENVPLENLLFLRGVRGSDSPTYTKIFSSSIIAIKNKSFKYYNGWFKIIVAKCIHTKTFLVILFKNRKFRTAFDVSLKKFLNFNILLPVLVL